VPSNTPEQRGARAALEGEQTFRRGAAGPARGLSVIVNWEWDRSSRSHETWSEQVFTLSQSGGIAPTSAYKGRARRGGVGFSRWGSGSITGVMPDPMSSPAL